MVSRGNKNRLKYGEPHCFLLNIQGGFTRNKFAKSFCICFLFRFFKSGVVGQFVILPHKSYVLATSLNVCLVYIIHFCLLTLGVTQYRFV